MSTLFGLAGFLFVLVAPLLAVQIAGQREVMFAYIPTEFHVQA